MEITRKITKDEGEILPTRDVLQKCSKEVLRSNVSHLLDELDIKAHFSIAAMKFDGKKARILLT